MAEQDKHIDLLWLETIFGIAPQSLPVDARLKAKELGPDGVRELVEQYRGTKFYRGRRVGREDLSNRLEQMHRLAFEGGGRWVRGEPVYGDTPSTWINQEVDEILEGQFG